MSTDVIPMQTLLFRARRDLEQERAMRLQAQDRVRELEESTRRAEERAEHLENERDGWVALAHKFIRPRVLYFDPDLTDQKFCEIADFLYDLHGQGADVDDDGLLAGLVNDWTGQ